MTRFWRGVRAGTAALAVTGLARAFSLTPFLPEILAQKLFAVVPMQFFEFFVRRLGLFAKWIAFGGTILLTLLVAGVVGLFGRYVSWGSSRLVRWMTLSFSLAATSFLLLFFLTDGDWLGHSLYPHPTLPAPVGLLAGVATYAAFYTFVDLRIVAIRSKQTPKRRHRST